MDPSLRRKERKKLDPEGKEAKKLRMKNGFHLNWDRADDLDELPVWEKNIFTHEKIDPQALLNSVRRHTEEGTDQSDLFGEIFNGLKRGDRWNFWVHEANWQNRLILGNSIEVMTSLVEKEKREGEVQCIFFDPPYGIDFNAFVPDLEKSGGG